MRFDGLEETNKPSAACNVSVHAECAGSMTITCWNTIMNSEKITTLTASFGHTPSGSTLFSVHAGIPLHNALEHLAANLANMAVLCDEACDADIRTTRAMNQIMGQLIDSSSGLLAAALEGLGQAAQG
ncbi:hypothetical protein [Pseudomonas sp.]|uniref:hypothetical protein n=1 Tax=Pseudomonas sp. TaxID=306 RepID=UPI003CC554E3